MRPASRHASSSAKLRRTGTAATRTVTAPSARIAATSTGTATATDPAAAASPPMLSGQVAIRGGSRREQQWHTRLHPHRPLQRHDRRGDRERSGDGQVLRHRLAAQHLPDGGK